MPQLLGKEIGPVGFGLMGLTWRPHPAPDEQAFEAMKASLKAGSNFWNAGEIYGPPHANSLHLLNRYFTRYPEDADKVVLSIKGGLKPNFEPDGSPEGIKRSVENCMTLLDGKKRIDLFECARVDKKVPIETTMKALEEYVKAGKIGGISLSEVSAATIKKAAAVTKIVAVEVELSMFSLDILNNGVAAACAEHSIPVVAYSPMGRGMLSGLITKRSDIPEGDFRLSQPRFSEENFEKNMELVHKLGAVADRRGCTKAQLALGWIIHLSKKDGNPEIIPIPGATTAERVIENSKVVKMSPEELKQIESMLSSFEVQGGRYGAAFAEHLEG